jgi:2-(1,2-epoxy-1,2-dihydrophenyl)acetyl-CoA isomerase
MSDATWTVGDVVVEVGDDHVATVTLNRPPDNFFDLDLIAAIADAYERLDGDDRCRAIVLRAEGKHFCAGARLGQRDASSAQTNGRHLYDEAVRIFAARTPVVAAVQGAAIGGGLGLAMSADFRVGTPLTRMSANFARLGFHHGFGLTVTLPAVVGQQRALQLLLTGARLGGDEAEHVGLLDRLVMEADHLDDMARRFAQEIATSAPLAVASIRATMRSGLVDRIRAATDHEKAEQERLQRTTDFAEGVRATAERRPAHFQGR